MASIRIPASWRLKESLATSTSTYLNRRQIVRALGLGVLGMASAARGQQEASQLAGPEDGPEEQKTTWHPAIGSRFADRFPVARNERYVLGERPLTPREVSSTHNNHYEFTMAKEKVWELAQDVQLNGWTVQVKGRVRRERQLDLETLMTRFPLEERLYRFRCVERWAMQVPWTGFPLSALLDWIEPLPSARFIKFTSWVDPEQMPGVRRYDWYPWPYYEALRLDEARHPLAFVAVGIYGQALPMQHGAPWRIVLPWKYGFKSAKSIVTIELTKRRPATFWNDTQPDEYGFFSNCDPSRPHPRWSQEWEQDIGTLETRPTLPYNGYAEEVSGLYTGREV